MRTGIGDEGFDQLAGDAAAFEFARDEGVFGDADGAGGALVLDPGEAADLLGAGDLRVVFADAALVDADDLDGR